MNENILKERKLFGRDLLGPILYDFCYRLRLYQMAFPPQDSVALYMTRGGLRLKYLFDIFLEVNGHTAHQPQHVFYTSRLAAAKGCLTHDLDFVSNIITREFIGKDVGSMLSSLMPGMNLSLKPEIASQKPDREVFKNLYSAKAEYGHEIRTYFGKQAALMRKYVDSLAGARKHVLLVDTGWTANTQAMLMRSYPERNWFGLYFGRWDYRKIKPVHFYNVVGISVDGIDYVKADYKTALFFYHHIIEDPLEVLLPSVETYCENLATGKIEANVQYPEHLIAPAKANDDVFCGMVEYFRNTKTRDHFLISRESENAFRKLAKKILNPSPRDIVVMQVRDRSEDFGKHGKVSVLRQQPLSNLKDKIKNIYYAIWKQGQVTKEFPDFYRIAHLIYCVIDYYARRKAVK